jgi:hypothetical protein
MMKRFLVLAACVAANFAMPASAADRFWETDAYKAKAHLFDVASAVFGCHFTLANDSVFRGVNRGVNTRELHNWHLHWHAGNARPAMAINHAQYCADAYKRLGPAGSKEVADVAGSRRLPPPCGTRQILTTKHYTLVNYCDTCRRKKAAKRQLTIFGCRL